MANTSKTRNEVGQAASSVAEKAKDLASDAKDRVQETAQNIADRASDMASNVGRRADSAASSAGSGMQSFAQTVREHGPSSGPLGSATSAVADTLEGAGEYLEQEGLSGMASDVTDLIRRNPIPALLIAVGVGYLLACATRS